MTARSRKYKRILALAAAASVTLSFVSGVSYGRMREWTSTEMVFSPTISQEKADGYSSNCLVAGGQRIYLADWDGNTPQRSIVIGIQRPEGTWIPSLPETVDETEPPDSLPEEPEIPDEPEIPEEPEILEVTWTVDSAVVHCVATVEEHSITLILSKTDTILERTPVQIHVAWQGLEGTFLVDLLPQADPQEQEPEETVTTELAIDSCGVINSEDPLAYIQVDPSATALVIGQEGGALSMVRCSLDGGQTYILLYDGGYLPLQQKPEEWNGLVFIDLSQAAISRTLDVQIEATGEGSAGGCTLRWQRESQIEPFFLKMANLPCPMAMDTTWGNAQTYLQVQKLGLGDGGQLVYTDSEAVVAIAANGALILRAGQQPEPGTYRLVITWIWNTICVNTQTIHFVVNTK